MAGTKILLIFFWYFSCAFATKTSTKEYQKCYSEFFLYDHDLRHLMSSINAKSGRESIQINAHENCVALGSKLEAHQAQIAKEALRSLRFDQKKINWNYARDLSGVKRNLEEILKFFDENADLKVHEEYYNTSATNSEVKTYVDCTFSVPSLMNFAAEGGGLFEPTSDCNTRHFRVKAFDSLVRNKIELNQARTFLNDQIAGELERLSRQVNDANLAENINRIGRQLVKKLRELKAENEAKKKQNIKKAFQLITRIDGLEVKFEKAFSTFSPLKNYLNFEFPEIFKEVYGCEWNNLKKLVWYIEKVENKFEVVVDALNKCGKLNDPKILLLVFDDERFESYKNKIYENFGLQIQAENHDYIVKFIQENDEYLIDYFKLFSAVFDPNSRSIEKITKFIDSFELSEQSKSSKVDILYTQVLDHFKLADDKEHVSFALWVQSKIEALKQKLLDNPEVKLSESTLKSFRYREKLLKSIATFESLKEKLPENIKVLLFKKCFDIKTSRVFEKFTSPVSKSNNFCAVPFDGGKYFRIESSQNRSQALNAENLNGNSFVLEGTGNSSNYFWEFIPKWNGKFMVISNKENFQAMSWEKMDHCEEEVKEWLFLKKCVKATNYNMILPGKERESQQWVLE